jgi:hypothetical protein
MALGAMAVSGAEASAQNCGPNGCGPLLGGLTGGCSGNGCVGNGTALFGPDRWTLFKRPDGNQPACASRSYPLSDWAYIRKYCGPSLIPGSCYGHFQTKWRRWEDVCPGSGAGDAPCAAVFPGAVAYPQPAPIGAYQPGMAPAQPGMVVPAPLPNPGNPGTPVLPPPTPLPGGTALPAPIPMPLPIPEPKLLENKQSLLPRTVPSAQSVAPMSVPGNLPVISNADRLAPPRY